MPTRKYADTFRFTFEYLVLVSWFFSFTCIRELPEDISTFCSVPCCQVEKYLCEWRGVWCKIHGPRVVADAVRTHCALYLYTVHFTYILWIVIVHCTMLLYIVHKQLNLVHWILQNTVPHFTFYNESCSLAIKLHSQYTLVGCFFSPNILCIMGE